jgi:mannose-1-phosphate guanylyltransferase/mannose-6-phosphate isomerase
VDRKIVPIILAGGSGTRLWPLSRENYPKQFLNLIGDYTLLQETALRTQQAIGCHEPIIVTNDAYYFLCQDQLASVGFQNAKYILETCARNTAPAIAIAAQYVFEYIDPQAILLVLPSDHLITEREIFAQSIQAGVKAAENGYLTIFGIKPTSGKTGYGYIEKGEQLNPHSFKVKRFIEKPNEEMANCYVNDGNYYWNSGMFLFRPKTYLDELRLFTPKIHEYAVRAYQQSSHKKDYFRIDKDTFANCPSDSIDYAIMEKTTKSVMIPLNLPWHDLGCWASVAEVGTKDENNNVVKGNVHLEYSKNCLISSEEKLVSAIGLNNHIVVCTTDAVLVADKKYSQDVKVIVEKLKAESNPIAKDHKKVFRPWGYYQSLISGAKYQVKYIMVKPGGRLSLQLHTHRCEHWIVVSGEALIENGDKVFTLYENQSTYITKGTKHRLSNMKNEPLLIIEVQVGDYLGEDDIIRFDDIYDRATL